MSIFLGAVKKASKSRNVLSAEEKQFFREESQESGQGYNYRPKILFGREILLKEKNGRPIQKWFIDFDSAIILAKKLNKLK
jgi:hypothetical protein